MKKILIQFTWHSKNIEKIITLCRKHNIQYDFFSYITDSQIIDDFPEDFEKGTHFSFCSIPPLHYSLKRTPEHYKSLDLFNKNNEIFIDSFYGNDFDKFEQDYILDGIKKGTIPYIPLLNEHTKIVSIDELKGRVFEQETFMKPSSSFKEFIGGTTLPGENFEEFMIRKKWGGKDVPVMLSPSYDIQSEYRFFVYNGVPLAGSSYIQNKTYNIEAPIPEAVQKEAERLAKIYTPSITFVMDLCVMKNGEIKIVEFNHPPASGQYNCVMDDFVHAIVNHQEPTLKKLKI